MHHFAGPAICLGSLAFSGSIWAIMLDRHGIVKKNQTDAHVSADTFRRCFEKNILVVTAVTANVMM